MARNGVGMAGQESRWSFILFRSNCWDAPWRAIFAGGEGIMHGWPGKGSVIQAGLYSITQKE